MYRDLLCQSDELLDVRRGLDNAGKLRVNFPLFIDERTAHAKLVAIYQTSSPHSRQCNATHPSPTHHLDLLANPGNQAELFPE
jgi:hypothetical protein